MEPRILAKSLDRIVKKHSTHCEAMPGLMGGSKLWQFTTKDAAGFVFMDTGEETTGIPTVTVALVLDSADEYEREDLLELLYANVALVDAAVCGMPSPIPGEPDLLLLQQKTRTDNFNPEDFPKILDHLMTQRDMLYIMDDEEDEEYSDDEEEEEDTNEKPWGHHSRK
ncbi:MAG TPA: hypothetical protein PLI09_09150 [Candidatus Hydrogenedentes bacterium]|nr:hypothetical protein [Candidatus Hydrogenedentota bacterium]